MSLGVGDHVFVNDMHPAKIVAFLDKNRCEVAWANGYPHSTVVILDSVTSMFAQPTRRRRAPQTYFEQDSAQAKKEMEAKKKPVVKKERKSAPVARGSRKETTTEQPPKKRKRTKEPLSRTRAAAAAAQAAPPLRSRDNKQAARKKRAPAISTNVPAAKPNRTRAPPAETDNDRNPAAKPTRKRLPAVSGEGKNPVDDVDEYDSSDTERLFSHVDKKPSAKSSSYSSTDHLSTSDESDDSSVDVKIKVEDDIPQPSSFCFQIGDNVWVKDGRTDHAAKVIADLDSLFQIEWISSGVKGIVEKSRVTSMDLTEEWDDGRRRSRRQRCGPIKNESKAKKPAPRKVKPAPRNKMSKASAAAPTTKSTREPRKAKSKVTTAESTTSAAASTQICLDDDEVTEATVEHTAHHDDPDTQSIHVISSMELFMTREAWGKPPQGPCNKKKNRDLHTLASPSGMAKDDVPRKRAAKQTMEEPPKVSQATHSPPISAERLGLDMARLLQDTPLKLKSECNVIRGPSLAASLSSPWSPTDTKALDLNESTETANPDEIPDIMLADSDSDKPNDERRITADPAEMSLLFAYK
jgi:hypothetical protein